MPKKEFRIIASNGTSFYEFFYLIQMPAGDFYYGTMGSEPSRTSVHVSGTVNLHWGKEKIIYPPTRKLNELKGLWQMCGMSIGRLVFDNPHFSKSPKKGKVTGLIYFDVRKFKSDVGVMIFLLEPNNYGALSSLNNFLQNPQINIVTETTPWLVIAIHENKNFEDSKSNS